MRSERSWAGAVVSAAIMIVVVGVTLVYVPNLLLGYLTTRLVPTWRDFVVVAYWVVAFVGCSILFVRLQRRAA